MLKALNNIGYKDLAPDWINYKVQNEEKTQLLAEYDEQNHHMNFMIAGDLEKFEEAGTAGAGGGGGGGGVGKVKGKARKGFGTKA